MKIPQKKNNKKNLITLTVVTVFVIVCALLGYVYVVKPNEKNNNPADNGKTNNSSSITSSKEENAKTSSIDASVTPTDPNGTFVSNHRPNLDGEPAPNLESSTCTTTPGASCEIRFTNGDIVKSLEPQKTDSTGNTSWNWTLQDIGLTEGQWKVSAVAINGSKTATSYDSILLDVQK